MNRRQQLHAYIMFLGVLFPVYASAATLHFSPQHIHPGQPVQVRTHPADVSARNVFLNPALPYIQQEMSFASPIRHHVVAPNAVFLILENNHLLTLQPHKQKGWTTTNTLHLPYPAHSLLLKNHRLLILSQGGLFFAYDVKQPRLPRLFHQGKFNSAIKSLQIVRNQLYALTADNHLSILQWNGGRLKTLGQHKLPPLLDQAQADPTQADQIQDFAFFQQHIYIAHGAMGLSVYEKNRQKTPQWRQVKQRLGQIIHLQQEGQQLWALNKNNTLFALSLKNGGNPQILSRFTSPTAIQNFSVDSSIAWLQSHEKLRVVVFPPGENLSPANFEANFGGSRKIALKDHMGYVADWFSGLHIYDLSTPQSPRLIRSVPTQGSPKGIIVQDQWAYLADDDNGLVIVDVSDPAKAKIIHTVDTPGLAYHSVIQGHWLYLADHSAGFHVINIENPPQSRIAYSVDTPGKTWSLAVDNERLYVADDNNGVLIFDLHNPARPQQIGHYHSTGAAEDIVIRDGGAYVAFFDDGIHHLDISDPHNPKLIEKIASKGNTRALLLENNTLYVANWQAGLDIYHAPPHQALRKQGHLDTPGALWGIAKQEDKLYLMDWWGGVSIAQLDSRQHPNMLSQYHDTGTVTQLLSRDGFLYTVNSQRGLQVYDIRTPLNPIWITALDLPQIPSHIALSEHYLWVALPNTGLAIIDNNNPFQLRLERLDMRFKNIEAIQSEGAKVWILDGQQLYQGDDHGPSFNLTPLIQEVGFFSVQANRLTATTSTIPQKIMEYELTEKNALLRASYAAPDNLHQLCDLDSHLLAAAGNQIFIMEPNPQPSWKKMVQLPHPIKKLQCLPYGKLLALDTRGDIYQLQQTSPASLLMEVYYPSFNAQDMVEEQGYLFLANATSSPVSLPLVNYQAEKQVGDRHHFQWRITSLSPGPYFLGLMDKQQGKIHYSPQILTLAVPKKSSKKFTLQDFEKALKQQQLLKSD